MGRHTDAPFAWGLPVSVAVLATLVVGAPLVVYGLHLNHRPIVGPAAQRQLAEGPGSPACPLSPAFCPTPTATSGKPGAAKPSAIPGLPPAGGPLGVGPAASQSAKPGANPDQGGNGNGGAGGGTAADGGGAGGGTGGTGGTGGDNGGGSGTGGSGTTGGANPPPNNPPPAANHPVSNADIAADVNVSFGGGAGGYSASVTLTNTGRSTANGWMLTFSSNNGTITSSSGAYVRISNSTLVATNTTANSALASGASVTFTYTATGSPTTPGACTFNGVSCSIS